MNTPLSGPCQLELVAEAARAPSAHNAQPARWRFLPDGRVLLFEDLDRRLPMADPTGRDTALGLGAAFEGLRIAVSRRGLGLSPPRPISSDGTGKAIGPAMALRPVVEARIAGEATPDPLADQVDRRRSWRASFAPPDAEAMESLGSFIERSPELAWIVGRDELRRWGRRHDQAAARFLGAPGYARELYAWLRLRPRADGWGRDGLTAPCLNLSPWEARVADLLMRPQWLRVLQRTGLARLLTAEAGVTASAWGLIVLHCPEGVSSFSAGRRFYRTWLRLTGMGLGACPMSALVDDGEAARDLARSCGIGPGGRVVSVLRVGAVQGPLPESPRLPPKELLV